MLHRVVDIPVLLEVADDAATKALVVLILDIDDTALSNKIGGCRYPALALEKMHVGCYGGKIPGRQEDDFDLHHRDD